MYKTLAQAIIDQQAVVIGEIAWSEAQKVAGLSISDRRVDEVQGNGGGVLDQLVSQYERLFGGASVEVCKDAVHPFLDKVRKQDLPKKLQ